MPPVPFLRPVLHRINTIFSLPPSMSRSLSPILFWKKGEYPGGVDITGQGVNLGQTLDYVLTFQNIGNDDADNYTIRDILP